MKNEKACEPTAQSPVGRGVEESLHFAAGAVNFGLASRNFQLKSCEDRRMVLTSAGDAQGAGLWRETGGVVPPCSCGTGKASRNMLLL